MLIVSHTWDTLALRFSCEQGVVQISFADGLTKPEAVAIAVITSDTPTHPNLKVVHFYQSVQRIGCSLPRPNCSALTVQGYWWTAYSRQ